MIQAPSTKQFEEFLLLLVRHHSGRPCAVLVPRTLRTDSPPLLCSPTGHAGAAQPRRSTVTRFWSSFSRPEKSYPRASANSIGVANSGHA